MNKNRTQPGLRLMIYDATEKRWGRLFNLSLIWRIGGWLYRLLGRLDRHHGATSWTDALVWLGTVEPARPIAAIQYWGHGRWGRALIRDESLDITCLDPRHALHEHLKRIRSRLVTSDSTQGGSLVQDSLVRDSHLAPHAVGIPSRVSGAEKIPDMGKDSPEGGCENGFTHQPIANDLKNGEPALWWFRTCETLGAECGQAFAMAWADFFNCRVAGHTHVIGFYQSGLHSLSPGESPGWSASEGILEGDAREPLRAAESRRGEPNTITCHGGQIPAGW